MRAESIQPNPWVTRVELRVEKAPAAETPAQALSAAPEAASAAGTAFDFRIDEASGEIVLNIVDETSGKTLYQIPSEVALRIARHLGIAGHFFDETA